LNLQFLGMQSTAPNTAYQTDEEARTSSRNLRILESPKISSRITISLFFSLVLASFLLFKLQRNSIQKSVISTTLYSEDFFLPNDTGLIIHSNFNWTDENGVLNRNVELLSLKSDDEKGELWHEFKKLYGKAYHSIEEEKERYNVFLGNLQHIDSYNTRSKGALHGITKFSDMTKDEFKSLNTLQLQSLKKNVDSLKEAAGNFFNHVIFGSPYLPSEGPDECQACERFPEIKDFLEDENLPDRFDWRTYGAVTNVKTQGLCGNCWAWAAAADIEGSWFLAGNDLVSVSAQQMSSCAPDSLCCVGGVMATGFDYVVNNGGIATEDDYPFVDDGGKCSECIDSLTSGPSQTIHITKWVNLMVLGDNLKRALIRYGPMSMGVNAQPMQFYQGGIDVPDDCDPTGLDHGVLLVGYGKEANGQGFWIIKNSWGPDWGEQGYYHISEEQDACGVGKLSMKSFI